MKPSRACGNNASTVTSRGPPVRQQMQGSTRQRQDPHHIGQGTTGSSRTKQPNSVRGDRLGPADSKPVDDAHQDSPRRDDWPSVTTRDCRMRVAGCRRGSSRSTTNQVRTSPGAPRGMVSRPRQMGSHDALRSPRQSRSVGVVRDPIGRPGTSASRVVAQLRGHDLQPPGHPRSHHLGAR